MTNAIQQISISTDKVGDVVLMGIYGGAICRHYRIESMTDGITTLKPVKAVSFRNNDGTFSHRYEVES